MTIATPAGSGEHGLFPPFTRFVPYNIVELPYRNSTGKRQGNFYVYESANIKVEAAYAIAVSESELLQRGWVFQEWLLSRRIVYYTQAGVFFQCQTDLPRNDSFEKIDPAASETLGQFLFLKKHFDFQSTESLNDLWYEIVETYCKRDLTSPEKDRILALAGVAKEFKEALTQRACNKQYSGRAGSFEYVSGLWLWDIHYGLLWEIASEGNRRQGRINGIPSWSWASRMADVEWAGRAGSIKNTCEAVGLKGKHEISFAVANVEERTQRAKEYEVDNMFTCLLIQCRMQPVYIGRGFSSGEEIEEARIVTGLDTGGEHWRAVCSPLRPNTISGWASIEELALEKQLSSYEGTVVQAFHVSTIEGVVGGVKLGYFGETHNVFNVLFVQNVGGCQFERVGVGRLYGKEISQGFREAVEQGIELV